MAHTESESEPLSEEVVFDVLSSPRRRYTLYYLRTVGGRAELNEIARQVAAWENDVAVENVERQQRKRVYVSLYQSHVPRLAETSVIEYDADAGVVTLADGAERVAWFLSGHREPARRWATYYVVVAAASALLVGAVGIGAIDLSGLAVAAVVTTLFAALAGIQFATERDRPADVPPDVDRADRES